MKKEYLIRNANLTGIRNYLNECKTKKDGSPFSCRDVLGYVIRGFLPLYLGGNLIEEVKKENCSVRLYNILNKDDNEDIK